MLMSADSLQQAAVNPAHVVRRAAFGSSEPPMYGQEGDMLLTSPRAAADNMGSFHAPGMPELSCPDLEAPAPAAWEQELVMAGQNVQVIGMERLPCLQGEALCDLSTRIG